MIEIDRVLHENIRDFGKAAYEKFICSELIQHWHELVDESIAAQIKPVTLERGILFVYAKSSAVGDQLKFFAEEIIDAINEAFRQEKLLVKDIKIAKGFQIVAEAKKNPPAAQVDEFKVPMDKITLTDEEIKRCEERTARLSNETLRQKILAGLLSQARLQKFRLANGWHKCAKCDALCPPEKMFCDVCRVKEREAMNKELAKIFYDAPWLKIWEAQKILLERMPHMRGECFPEVIESARTSLIQKVAGSIRFADEKSPAVLKLVMLEQRLTPDKLTPAIIRRTLNELQFNLPDLARFTLNKK